MTVRASLIVPSLGYQDMLERLLRSLTATAEQQYEVCIGFDPESTEFSLPSAGHHVVQSAVGGHPGMNEAIEVAISRATSDWLVMVHDDMVFLPGWENFPLRLDDILCFELLDAKGLTWPPAVGLEAAADEARRRTRVGVVYGGPFFGTSICHRSKWVPWPSWSGTKYRTHDTAWLVETHRVHPDVAFGWLPGRCLFHAISGSVSRRDFDPDDPDEFQKRYGSDTRGAEGPIYEHSRRLRGG